MAQERLIHAELIAQRDARLVVGRRRGGGVARPVLGQHQLPPGALAQRVAGEVLTQHRQHLAVLGQGEPGLDEILDRVEPLLAEAGEVGRQQATARRGAMPQAERRGQRERRLPGTWAQRAPSSEPRYSRPLNVAPGKGWPVVHSQSTPSPTAASDAMDCPAGSDIGTARHPRAGSSATHNS